MSVCDWKGFPTDSLTDPGSHQARSYRSEHAAFDGIFPDAVSRANTERGSGAAADFPDCGESLVCVLSQRIRNSYCFAVVLDDCRPWGAQNLDPTPAGGLQPPCERLRPMDRTRNRLLIFSTLEAA